MSEHYRTLPNTCPNGQNANKNKARTLANTSRRGRARERAIKNTGLNVSLARACAFHVFASVHNRKNNGLQCSVMCSLVFGHVFARKSS